MDWLDHRRHRRARARHTLVGHSRRHFFVAAAAYFALPPAHRTRSSASLVGSSVGFVLAVLGSFWRTGH
jgi:hypothetical protein